jgi:hypothetical protein
MINNSVVTKSQMRDEIIEFFFDKKLNKNCYFRNWYINHGCLHIYKYIESYYNIGDKLYNSPLSQRLYHIINNHENIPTTKFINFVVGYRKGRKTVSGKSINTFIKKIPIDPQLTTTTLTIDKLQTIVTNYITQSAYSTFISNILVINNILLYTVDIKDVKYKIAYFYNNLSIYCKCGKYKKFTNINTFKLNNTCGNDACVRGILSDIGKIRDLSYLQTNKIKHKRIESRKGYKHTKITKDKISESNKKVWTKEKKQLQVSLNIKSGSYIKSSNTMRQKILSGVYTPKTCNRFTKHRLYSIKTGLKCYRSSWEVIFHENNPHLLYEHTRIEYMYNDNMKVYIVDFTDLNTRTLYEIKPKEFITDTINQLKIKSAIKWCLNNNFTFKLITQDNLWEKI